MRVNAIHEAAGREAAAVKQQASQQIAAMRQAAEREAAAILAMPGASARSGGYGPESVPSQRLAALPAAPARTPAGQASRPAAPGPRHAT